MLPRPPSLIENEFECKRNGCAVSIRFFFLLPDINRLTHIAHTPIRTRRRPSRAAHKLCEFSYESMATQPFTSTSMDVLLTNRCRSLLSAYHSYVTFIIYYHFVERSAEFSFISLSSTPISISHRSSSRRPDWQKTEGKKLNWHSVNGCDEMRPFHVKNHNFKMSRPKRVQKPKDWFIIIFWTTRTRQVSWQSCFSLRKKICCRQ